jgi:hypothetical protein
MVPALLRLAIQPSPWFLCSATFPAALSARSREVPIPQESAKASNILVDNLWITSPKGSTVRATACAHGALLEKSALPCCSARPAYRHIGPSGTCPLSGLSRSGRSRRGLSVTGRLSCKMAAAPVDVVQQQQQLRWGVEPHLVCVTHDSLSRTARAAPPPPSCIPEGHFLEAACRHHTHLHSQRHRVC